jgi:predicted metalloprotease with PDZ domain
VELRRRTNGASSLDTVLRALHTNSDYERTWSADELLARLDELAGTKVFEPLAKECLDKPFPEVEATLAALGLSERGFVDDAPLAGIRRALLGER